MKKVFEKARENHEIFDALIEAYKWSNRFTEKMFLVEDIRLGCSKRIHSTLEEEVAEMNSLLKKAVGKVLYLNYLTGGATLHRQYNTKSAADSIEMICDFVIEVADDVRGMTDIAN